MSNFPSREIVDHSIVPVTPGQTLWFVDHVAGRYAPIELEVLAFMVERSGPEGKYLAHARTAPLSDRPDGLWSGGEIHRTRESCEDYCRRLNALSSPPLGIEAKEGAAT